MIRLFRKSVHVYERTIPFLRITFSRNGLGSSDGRQLIRGKARRVFLSFFPALVKHLQKKHGIQGGCVSCGASCNLMFQCPHWDTETHLCTVYEDRPNICRFFPITPADIEDRNIILKGKSCGFTFKK